MRIKTKLCIKRCENYSERFCKLFRFRANAIHPYVVYLSLFIYSLLFSSLAFALPLQIPLPGIYQCFVAGDNPFNANAARCGCCPHFARSQLHPDNGNCHRNWNIYNKRNRVKCRWRVGILFSNRHGNLSDSTKR